MKKNKSVISNFIKALVRDLCKLCLFSWLPVMVICFSGNPQQLTRLLATTSIFLALGIYGYGVTWLLHRMWVDRYNRMSKDIKTMKENRATINAFIKWAEENDQKII